MNNSDDYEFKWLMDWYAKQCNGDWEHSYGINIETIDNPGWSLTIDLNETDLESIPFAEVNYNMELWDSNPDISWYYCKVEKTQFCGHGGVHDLKLIIKTFRLWFESNSKITNLNIAQPIKP